MGSPEQESSFIALLCYLETDYWLSSSHNKPQGQFHLGKKADKKENTKEDSKKSAPFFFTRIPIRAEKGKEITSSMYKVRTLPVHFASNNLGEDRSRQSYIKKPQRTLASSPRRLQLCIFYIVALCVCGIERTAWALLCDKLACFWSWIVM